MPRESARIGVQLMDGFKPIGRRRFVQGLAGSALLLAQGRGRALAAGSVPSELVGPDFHLTIDELPVNYTGAARRAVAPPLTLVA